jgi:putative ABC transport system permease protein
MATFLQDLRHAVRLMLRAPGFTLAALLTLALAIGVNTAVFSVIYGVLLRPLPYADADQIVVLSEEHPGGNAIIRDPRLSNLTFEAWRERARTITGLSGYSTQTFTVASGNDIERIDGGSLSPAAFTTLGVTPAIGRFFHAEEAVAGNNNVVVLSDRLWRSKFGADPHVVGRALQIDGRVQEIVGVAPASFYFPDRDALLWTPYIVPPTTDGSMRIMPALARLTPGSSLQQAAIEGTAAARSVKRPMAAELLFGKGGPVEVRVNTIVDSVTRRVRPALLILMAAVGLVLLVACANVANLLLARGTARARELAVRAALGAGAGRLARQMLTESAAMGLIGGALGVFIAWALTKAVPAWAPEGFPRLDDIHLDARVLGFALSLSLVAGAAAGLLPAWRASSAELSPTLRTGDSRSVGSGERVRGLLLAFEAALSVVLLIGAALLVRSFVTLAHVDPGYDARNVLTARIYLTGAASARERRAHLIDALMGRLRATPAVVAVGVGNMAPLGESSFVSGFSFGTNDAGQPVIARALQYVVTSGYAEALKLRLKEGRSISTQDEASPVEAMLVNEAFARAYIRDGRPVVGRQYKGLLGKPEMTTAIVGVVGDVLKDGLDTKAQPEIYLALNTLDTEHSIAREINLVIRANGDPAALGSTLRAMLRDIEPTAALGRVGPLASQVADSVSEPRFSTAVLGAFALLALGIAITGLYGVLSYNVSQRRKEIGIRAALGATRRDLIGLVVRQGLTVTLAGLGAGVFIAALAARRMQPLLFGIGPLDLPSFVFMPAVLLIVAALACVIPARRAAATDPATTLRAE